MRTDVANSWMGSTIPTLDLTHGASIDPPSLTPYRVIYRSGKASVRHYRAVEPRRRIPIVLVYALIKRPFVLDLEPGRSVVEGLTRQGFEVFLIDWLPPNAADSWRGFDAYVNQDLANAVHAVRVHQGVEQVTVLGYCLGALLSVIYAALHPRHVRNLVTLTLPLDTSVREPPAYQLTDWLDESAVVSSRPRTATARPGCYKTSSPGCQQPTVSASTSAFARRASGTSMRRCRLPSETGLPVTCPLPGDCSASWLLTCSRRICWFAAR